MRERRSVSNRPTPHRGAQTGPPAESSPLRDPAPDASDSLAEVQLLAPEWGRPFPGPAYRLALPTEAIAAVTGFELSLRRALIRVEELPGAKLRPVPQIHVADLLRGRRQADAHRRR